MRIPGASVASPLVIGIGASIATVYVLDPELYNRLVQEDGCLEWGTFWAFLSASGVALLGARRHQRRGRFPWCFVGIALFCFVVAMEEISWGQRLVGYRAPVYFLEHNFQQELNVHNVVSTPLRKLVKKVVIGLYGVALPLIVLHPRIALWSRRVGLVLPPLALVPAFALNLVLYVWYPMPFTGEVVELVLGLSFLSAMLARWSEVAEGEGQLARRPDRTASIGVAAAVAVLSLTSATLSASRRGDPATLVMARNEISALQRDLKLVADRGGGELPTKCKKIHKRIYNYLEKYGVDDLRGLEFSGLVGGGEREGRAHYFLDPWNSPYWIRLRCSKDRKSRRTVVYSFGPNRRRDSSKSEIRGDDLGKSSVRARDSKVDE